LPPGVDLKDSDPTNPCQSSGYEYWRGNIGDMPLEKIKGDQTGEFDNEATIDDLKYPKQIFGLKGAIYKAHKHHLTRKFDSLGEFILTDESREGVKP